MTDFDDDDNIPQHPLETDADDIEHRPEVLCGERPEDVVRGDIRNLQDLLKESFEVLQELVAALDLGDLPGFDPDLEDRIREHHANLELELDA